MATAPTGLAKKSIGTSSMFWFCVGASAPMTVLAGSVVATYATSGVVAVPLSFILLALVLSLFTVGYMAMSRHVPHAATFYAYLARGVGRVGGVAGALVALLAYNSIQICLYGLLGSAMAGLLGGVWWVWALVAWAAIAVLGVLHVGINAIVLASVLICEITVILLFDVASFVHPAGGHISIAPLTPSSLFVNGVGSVFAFGIAAFVGYELAPVFGEEARSQRTVARATFGALAFLGVFYAISSWALATAIGPDSVVATARDLSSGIPFSIIEQQYGKAMSYISLLLFVTSIFAAMLSFHNGVGRYLFGMSRDGVLPAALSRVGYRGSRAGAPIGGSVVQSGLALIVVAAFAVAGADPVVTLFTWLSTIAALGVMLLMLVTNVAVIGFFRKGGGAQEGAWRRAIAPALGLIGLVVVLGTTVYNISAVTATAPDALVNFLLPGLVALTAIIGIVWGLALRANPEVYRRIGVGEPEPLAVLEHDLSDLRV
jgi:amino acid transporter